MVAKEDSVCIVVLDTLRKDYGDKYIWPVLKKYGFEKYDNAIAPAPWTLPSHASMLTGLYPLYHGAHIKAYAPRVNPTRTLFYEYGNTALITANPYITPHFGFKARTVHDAVQLFTISAVFTEKEEEEYRKICRKYRAGTKLEKAFALLRAGKVHLLAKALIGILRHRMRTHFSGWPLEKGVTEITQWIWKNWAQYNFALVNLMEMHEPYNVVEQETWFHGYDVSAKYLAGKLDELMGVMEDKGVLEGKVIVVSDHGQMLGEYGAFGHGTWLYDELLRVPFYAKNIDFPRDGFFDLTAVYKRVRGEDVRGGVAISESFGVRRSKAIKLSEREFEKLNKYRIAVYYKEYKGIFNVDDWRWERWKTYNGKEEVPREVQKEMTRIVLNHLKGALAAKAIKKSSKLSSERRFIHRTKFTVADNHRKLS